MAVLNGNPNTLIQIYPNPVSVHLSNPTDFNEIGQVNWEENWVHSVLVKEKLLAGLEPSLYPPRKLQWNLFPRCPQGWPVGFSQYFKTRCVLRLQQHIQNQNSFDNDICNLVSFPNSELWCELDANLSHFQTQSWWFLFILSFRVVFIGIHLMIQCFVNLPL